MASAVDAGLALWGPDLFAYLLGAGVNLPLAQWRLDEVLKDHLTRARLRTVQDLAAQFENNPPAARAWVRRRNPELGARPAEVIRRGTEDDLQQVRELAERDAGRPRIGGSVRAPRISNAELLRRAPCAGSPPQSGRR